MDALASDRTLYEGGERIGSPLQPEGVYHWYYAYTNEQPMPPLWE